MELKCIYCEKVYKTQQSRSNHHRIYHKTAKPIIIQSQPIVQPSIVNPKYTCKNCNAVFTTRQAKSRHMLKTCNNKQKLEIENDQI
jgi:hypothetical protein